MGEVQVPASVSNLLEYRMAQHGHDVVGFTVHVPHYLAQTDYPVAAEALLTQVAKTGELQIPLTALTEAAAEVHAKIDEQVEASTEVAQVVRALERQYDAFVALRRTVLCWRAMRTCPAAMTRRRIRTIPRTTARRQVKQRRLPRRGRQHIRALTGLTMKLAK